MLHQSLEGDMAPGQVETDLDLARRRKAQTERRLRWLETCWNDAAAFRRIVTAGRYLQLCMLTEWASNLDAAAACRVTAAERGAPAEIIFQNN